MFELMPADPEWESGGVMLDDDPDGMLEGLLAEWAPEPPGDPEPTLGSCAPSGWLALDLDTATDDPAFLDDATLVEAMVGFDRLASWAAARQARLLAELARRRPTDRAPHAAR